jgi:uncharacterized protein YoxC
MTATEAIEKIIHKLGLQFKSEKFATTFLVDGTEVSNNMDEEFKIGQTLFVVNESTLTPAPEGNHETREGLIVTVDAESTILAMAEKTVEAPADEADKAEEEVKTDEVMEKMPEMEEDVIAKVVEILTPIMEEMKSMREEMKKMNSKFNGDVDTIKKDFESFKKQPERKAIDEKKTYVESFSDYKLELIKAMRK